MSDLQEFLDWLDEQDYWVKWSKVQSEFPEISFETLEGITMKEGSGGKVLVPKRDLRVRCRDEF